MFYFVVSAALLLVACGKHNESELSSLAEREVVLISDIDDTLRRTAVRHPYYLAKNGLRKKNITFLHLADLWGRIAADSKPARFYYVTAASQSRWFNFFEIVSQGVKNDGFPDGEFFGRPADIKDIVGYKLERHRHIINQHKTSRIILVGDDTQHDQQVFDQLRQDYPEVDMHYFIHLVDNDEVRPVAVHHYVTAADLAVKMFDLTAISLASTKYIIDQIAASVTDEKLRSRIWPKWMNCHGFADHWRELVETRSHIFARQYTDVDAAYAASCSTN